MNDTDLDIILGIAGYQLTGQEKRDALERIASDPELSAELASQVAALEGLKTIRAVSMTAAERASLRSNLRERLHLDPLAPAVVATRQRRPWWQPVLGLASAAALIVAIVSVPSMFSGSDDSGVDIVAVAPETAAVEDTARNQDDTGGGDLTIAVPEVAQDDVLEFFADADALVPTTKSAPIAGTDTSGEDEGRTLEDGIESGDEGTDGALENGAALLGTPFTTFEAEEVEVCLTSLEEALPPGELVAHAATTTAAGVIVHFGIGPPDGIEYAVSVDISTCSIVDIDG
jgi:hypothetical protein